VGDVSSRPLKEEEARINALLTLSKGQLNPIETTVSPGASKAQWWSVIGVILSVAFFLIDIIISGRLF